VDFSIKSINLSTGRSHAQPFVAVVVVFPLKVNFFLRFGGGGSFIIVVLIPRKSRPRFQSSPLCQVNLVGLVVLLSLLWLENQIQS